MYKIFTTKLYIMINSKWNNYYVLVFQYLFVKHNHFLANGEFDHSQLPQDTDTLPCHLDQGTNCPIPGRTNECQQTGMNSFQMDEFPSIVKGLSHHFFKLEQGGLVFRPSNHKHNLYKSRMTNEIIWSHLL